MKLFINVSISEYPELELARDKTTFLFNCCHLVKSVLTA